MSVSLESWEGVLYTVQKFYTPDLRPYYNDEYIGICLDVIGQTMGKSSFDYVLTIASLPEPICTNNRVIVISLPMLQHLLDKHVIFPEHKLEQVTNFDIFKDFNILQDTDNADHRHGSSVCDYMVRWDASVLSTAHNSFARITQSQITSMVILFRLVVCVAHWNQHYKNNTSPNNHNGFNDIEIADLKKTFEKLTSESEPVKSFKKLKSGDSVDINKYFNNGDYGGDGDSAGDYDGDSSDEDTSSDTDTDESDRADPTNKDDRNKKTDVCKSNKKTYKQK